MVSLTFYFIHYSCAYSRETRKDKHFFTKASFYCKKNQKSESFLGRAPPAITISNHFSPNKCIIDNKTIIL